ncbi:hypothetical protein ALC60_00752, partial [Trachymyrmex zeteki]
SMSVPTSVSCSTITTRSHPFSRLFTPVYAQLPQRVSPIGITGRKKRRSSPLKLCFSTATDLP